jgi:hypothetical protein
MITVFDLFSGFFDSLEVSSGSFSVKIDQHLWAVDIGHKKSQILIWLFDFRFL